MTGKCYKSHLELSVEAATLMTALFDRYGKKRLHHGITFPLGEYSLTTLNHLANNGYLERCIYNPVTFKIGKMGVVFIEALITSRKFL